MTATLETRGILDAHNPAVRGLRATAHRVVEHRVIEQGRTEQCTGARRVSGGIRTGEHRAFVRPGSVPVGAGTGRTVGDSGESTDGRTTGATLYRLAPVEQSVPQGEQGGAQGEHSAAEVDHLTEFTAYVRERRASLYVTAYHLTGDRYEAEDLLQSALFSTYRAWGRISDKAAVGGYLRRTMTNLHISAWRRRKLNEYPTEELPETVGDTDAMGGTELRAVLWQALAKLPENQRTMLVLRYYEGRTDPEIADILNISVGTVKSSIWRALRRLRDDEQLNRNGDTAHAFGELVA
ncbi:SigE family RNA polymerase sigma factor [Kitasatospora sp. NBC_01302]|uniref:SigE family RNA polymerase sigma factor n=1 Tax=Kitasatospora sp. NBC_01302 TaxID=2903575 RepID=UPI003FA37A0A